MRRDPWPFGSSTTPASEAATDDDVRGQPPARRCPVVPGRDTIGGSRSPEEASWRLNDRTWTVDEIVYHIASCEIEYCRQGFDAAEAYERTVGDVAQSIALLDRAQVVMLSCLEECSEADLDQPVPTRFHGESAAHFFWIMVMHRVSHAAQIRTIRRAFGSRTHYYPI